MVQCSALDSPLSKPPKAVDHKPQPQIAKKAPWVIPIEASLKVLHALWPERFSWEERDGVADSFARRGESEARADGRPVTSEQRSSCGRRRGGKGHDGHTGMIYNRGGMRHWCWSLVIVNTERGRQVGDVVLHHGLPRSRGVTSALARSW